MTTGLGGGVRARSPTTIREIELLDDRNVLVAVHQEATGAGSGVPVELDVVLPDRVRGRAGDPLPDPRRPRVGAGGGLMMADEPTISARSRCQRAFQLYVGGDIEGLLELYNPDVVVTAPDFMNAGPFHGHEGFMEWISALERGVGRRSTSTSARSSRSASATSSLSVLVSGRGRAAGWRWSRCRTGSRRSATKLGAYLEVAGAIERARRFDARAQARGRLAIVDSRADGRSRPTPPARPGIRSRSRSRRADHPVRRRDRRGQPAPPRRRGRASGGLPRRRRAADVLRRLLGPGDGPGDPRPRGRDELRRDGPRRPGVRVGRAGLRGRRDHDHGHAAPRSRSATARASTSSSRSRPTRTAPRP